MRRILPNELGRGEPNDICILVLVDVSSKGKGTDLVHTHETFSCCHYSIVAC